MKYFTIDELTKSNTAIRMKIDNEPNGEQLSNLMDLVDNVLDPLREAYGKAIKVTSGFRSFALNKEVNGSKTSQHLKGQAADITGGSVSENKKIFSLCKALQFDQLIDEYDYKWIHVSYNKNKNRKQILKIG